MPSSHLILCRPLLLLPSIPPSIRVFSNESTLCMRWPKFQLRITPSKGRFFFFWGLQWSKRRNSKILIVSKPSSFPYREHCADKPCNRIFDQLFSTPFSNINSQESPEYLKTAFHTKDRHPNKQADSKDNKNLEEIEESHYVERLHLSWCIYYSVGPDSPCKINEQ